MIIPAWQDPAQTQLAKTRTELESCNRELESHGLALTAEDVDAGAVEYLRAFAPELLPRIEVGLATGELRVVFVY